MTDAYTDGSRRLISLGRASAHATLPSPFTQPLRHENLDASDQEHSPVRPGKGLLGVEDLKVKVPEKLFTCQLS